MNWWPFVGCAFFIPVGVVLGLMIDALTMDYTEVSFDDVKELEPIPAFTGSGMAMA